jgi:hypothetical protein
VVGDRNYAALDSSVGCFRFWNNEPAGDCECGVFRERSRKRTAREIESSCGVYSERSREQLWLWSWSRILREKEKQRVVRWGLYSYNVETVEVQAQWALKRGMSWH